MLIFPKSKDLSKWYESVLYYSGIASPGLVKGTFFIHPRGWAIWEKIQEFLNAEFKKHDIKNVSFPSFIPISEIEKEKEKLTGFLPELFLVSKSHDKEAGKIFLRPTSEILFSHYFKKNLNSYEDLPILLNQWCNVFRAEKNTKLFLRTSEFHWQEAHTLHLTESEACKYLNVFHSIYKKMVNELLSIAFLEGEKTKNERFVGALNTLTLEAIMPDGQALQIATSHYLGKNFSKMFEISFTNNKNLREYPFQISAGSSTRLLGALILSHSDDKGLVLPFNLAEVQVKICVLKNCIDKNSELYSLINNHLQGFSYKWDFSDKSFGFKTTDQELKGIPFAIFIGNKELNEQKLTIKSRIKNSTDTIKWRELKDFFINAVKEYNDQLFNNSLNNLKNSIVKVETLEEAKNEILNNKKVVLVNWCDDEENEMKFKSEKFSFGPRCIFSKISKSDVKCFYSGKPATVQAYFSRSY